MLFVYVNWKKKFCTNVCGEHVQQRDGVVYKKSLCDDVAAGSVTKLQFFSGCVRAVQSYASMMSLPGLEPTARCLCTSEGCSILSCSARPAAGGTRPRRPRALCSLSNVAWRESAAQGWSSNLLAEDG